MSADSLFRDGLVRIVAEDASMSVVQIDEHGRVCDSVDVLLLDSAITDAFATCTELQHSGNPAVILVGAPDGDVDWATQALRAGARGILTRRARAEHLLQAISVVNDGLFWAPRRAMAACIHRVVGDGLGRGMRDAALEQRLSLREREVLKHAAVGMGNRELAARLSISEATVKVHLTNIFKKLGLRGRAELAAAYYGLIAAPDFRPVARSFRS